MTAQESLIRVPDMEKKIETTKVLFEKEQQMINMEILRRCMNALQKAFGKKRNQASTTVWLMVYISQSPGEINLLRNMIEEAVSHAEAEIESCGCSVDKFFVDRYYPAGRRLIYMTLTANRIKGKKVKGAVNKHILLAKRKKAMSRYKLLPRLKK